MITFCPSLDCPRSSPCLKDFRATAGLTSSGLTVRAAFGSKVTINSANFSGVNERGAAFDDSYSLTEALASARYFAAAC